MVALMHDSTANVSVTADTVPNPRLAYRVRDAAAQIGIHERMMWRYIQTGAIQSFKIGGSRRITHEALVAFIKAAVERQLAAAKKAAA